MDPKQLAPAAPSAESAVQDALTEDQRSDWNRNGFFYVRGFAAPEILGDMTARIVALARRQAAGESLGDAYVVPEPALAHRPEPEDRLSKIFRVHRDEEIFRAFCTEARLTDLLTGILGTEIDCFLSQFIFKLPGALGQPWHQDAFYFPFDRRPQVGAWLAVTDSREDNGPLWVLPGSHREAVHPVVADSRQHANFAYVEIVDHDMGEAIPVLMEPGDLLLFHSHLMHRSTDNESQRKRAAMVYHFAEAGTVDGSKERFGMQPPNIDWMPVRRSEGSA